MPRKKQDSILEEMLSSIYHAPFLAGPISAGLLYVIGELLVPAMAGSTTIGKLIASISTTFTPWLCALVVAAAVLGAGERAITRRRDRTLFDRQSGIESIRSLSWQTFERMVGEGYRRLGYEVQVTPAGADGGVDLILTKDGLRTDVQCKQWRTQVVPVELVRQLKGAMAAADVEKGIFVSSGRFTTDAQAFAEKAGITTVDGPALERLVSGLQRGPARVDALSRNDLRGCPRCGSTMVRRTSRRGGHKGEDFLGCSRFPACRGTRPLS
jgi:restriction system protein